MVILALITISIAEILEFADKNFNNPIFDPKSTF